LRKTVERRLRSRVHKAYNEMIQIARSAVRADWWGDNEFDINDLARLYYFLHGFAEFENTENKELADKIIEAWCHHIARDISIEAVDATLDKGLISVKKY